MMPKGSPAAARPVEERASDSPSWPRGRDAALAYLVLSLAYFLPALLPGRQVFGTDYLAGGYMFYEFIGERLASGALPKWVPYVYGGMPLAANPGSTYHPVHLLADLLLPTSKVLAVVFLTHLWLGAIGTFLLGRELGCRRWIAFLAGLAFQFTGILASWVYAGHDGRIMVAASAPLFFYFLRRGIRTARLGPFVGAALTLGSALLSFQIQNSYYLLVAALLWALFSLWDVEAHRAPGRLARVVGLGVASVAFGFLLAAINFVPFLGYIPESPRGEGGRGYEFSTSFSMPEGELLSLAVPEHHGVSVGDPGSGEPLFPEYRGENPFKLHTEYVGAFVLVMLVLGAHMSRRDRRWWFFAGLAVFALTIALGGNTPIYRLYYAVLPGTRQFRAPSLAFFVVALSLVAMAALTMERLARLRDAAGEPRKPRAAEEGDPLRLVPWLAGGWAVVGVLGAMATSGTPGVAQGWMRLALFAGAVGAVVAAWTLRKLGSTATFALLSLVVLVDLWVIDRRFFHTVEGPEVVFAEDDVTAFLAAQPEPSRVWTFPYPQTWRAGGPNGGNFPMIYEIEQAGGEHPNPLRRWIDYLGAGEQTYTDWHNFVAGASVAETAEGPAVQFTSRPGFLEAANIRYVVSLAPLSHPSLREVHRGSALVYENTAALPRAYLVPAARTVPDGAALAAMEAPGWDPRAEALVDAGEAPALPPGPLQGEARVVEHTPDRVVVRTSASRSALLVVADNYYPGWRARVGGEDAAVLRVNHTFRGVAVPAGEGEVVLEFAPGDLRLGLLVSLGALALLLGTAALTTVGARRARGADAAP